MLQSPVKPGYYIGIGSASKLAHPLDAEAVAKQNALDNLSREIRVQVQSTNTTNALQVNGWLSESFAAESRSTTNEDLEGFTLVDTYTTDAEVMVYYELNKAKHAQLQETKRQTALNVAWGHLQSARNARSSAQVQQAVDAAIRGLDAVRPYMDRPMMHVGRQRDRDGCARLFDPHARRLHGRTAIGRSKTPSSPWWWKTPSAAWPTSRFCLMASLRPMSGSATATSEAIFRRVATW